MFGAMQYLNESIHSVLNSILTPELLNAWDGLTSTSQMRIAVLIGCSALAGAILMTAGARFLLLAGLVVLVTPYMPDAAWAVSGHPPS